jgi:hypothetical protein
MCSAKSLKSMSNLTQTVVTSATICGLPKFITIEDYDEISHLQLLEENREMPIK